MIFMLHYKNQVITCERIVYIIVIRLYLIMAINILVVTFAQDVHVFVMILVL